MSAQLRLFEKFCKADENQYRCKDTLNSHLPDCLAKNVRLRMVLRHAVMAGRRRLRPWRALPSGRALRVTLNGAAFGTFSTRELAISQHAASENVRPGIEPKRTLNVWRTAQIASQADGKSRLGCPM